jgi:hypothetical protein
MEYVRVKVHNDWMHTRLRPVLNVPLKSDHNYYHFKSAYGLTKEEYIFLLESNPCCPICGKNFKENNLRPCVDHSHVTNLVRGILCIRCNTLLGVAKDNKEILLKAIEYLSK